MEIDSLTLISLIASLSSVILAVVAIWLSFQFFSKSSESAEKTIEASKDVNSSVEKLEKLFDKLYSDTFSIMKETVTDMRKQLWSGDTQVSNSEIETELELKAKEKVDLLKSELTSEIDKILSHQNKADTELNKLQVDLKDLINKAVTQTRTLETEAKEETLRNFIYRTLGKLQAKYNRVTVDHLINQAIDNKAHPQEIIDELYRMKKDQLVVFTEEKINSGLIELKTI